MHDNVPADVYRQGGRKSASLVQLSPEALTGVPDWVTPAVQPPTFWDCDGFNFKRHGRHLAPSSSRPDMTFAGCLGVKSQLSIYLGIRVAPALSLLAFFSGGNQPEFPEHCIGTRK